MVCCSFVVIRFSIWSIRRARLRMSPFMPPTAATSSLQKVFRIAASVSVGSVSPAGLFMLLGPSLVNVHTLRLWVQGCASSSTRRHWLVRSPSCKCARPSSRCCPPPSLEGFKHFLCGCVGSQVRLAVQVAVVSVLRSPRRRISSWTALDHVPLPHLQREQRAPSMHCNRVGEVGSGLKVPGLRHRCGEAREERRRQHRAEPLHGLEPKWLSLSVSLLPPGLRGLT